ncbi:MAG: hypothetical protein WDN06_06025 [Asticcacaulis sp.]
MQRLIPKMLLKILVVTMTLMAAAVEATATPLTIGKAAATTSDPVDTLLLPKAIPGAVITYTLTVRNPLLTPAAKNVVITDSISTATTSGAEYYVGVDDANPFVYTDGLLGLLGASGMTYTWSGLNSATDSVSFSCDNGATWTCTVQRTPTATLRRSPTSRSSSTTLSRRARVSPSRYAPVSSSKTS